MGKLKIGCVGLRRGRDLLTNVLLMKDVEIRAICDMDEDRRNSAKEFFEKEKKVENLLVFDNFEDLLNSDVEAIIIATEASAHVRMSVQALDAGKHVLSEIPAINTVEEAKTIRAAVNRHPNLKYMVGENCCYWAFIRTWKTMYENGMLGDVWHAEAEYLHNVVHLMRDKDGNPTWRASYNAIKYLTHDLGPLLYILDDRCTSVSGYAPKINPIAEYSTGTPNELAVFTTAKGATIKIFCSFGITQEPARHNFIMYGSKGTIETARMGEERCYAYLKDIPHTKGPIEIPVSSSYPDASSEILGGHGGGDYFMVKAFVDCILKDEKPPIDVDLGIRISIPGIFAHESAMKGGIPVKIEEI